MVRFIGLVTLCNTPHDVLLVFCAVIAETRTAAVSVDRATSSPKAMTTIARAAITPATAAGTLP